MLPDEIYCSFSQEFSSCLANVFGLIWMDSMMEIVGDVELITGRGDSATVDPTVPSDRREKDTAEQCFLSPNFWIPTTSPK